MTMKTCTSCDEEKPLEEFYNSKKGPLGKSYDCKECRKAYNKKRREESIDEYREKDRERIANNLERQLLRAAKARSKAKDIPFDLEKSDIVIPEECPVLGIPLVRGAGRPVDGSPTLDKFVPLLGYTKGNVNVISHKANTCKNDATLEEIRLLYEWMKEIENNKTE